MCISNVSPTLNPKSILNYFHPLNTLLTTPCYFIVGDENVTPICNYDESAHAKLTHCRSILQHWPTINLFVKKFAMQGFKCSRMRNGDVASQNLPSMYKTLIDIAFQNPTQRMPRTLASHSLSHRKLMDPSFHNLSLTRSQVPS
jgi:hypothetical protein